MRQALTSLAIQELKGMLDDDDEAADLALYRPLSPLSPHSVWAALPACTTSSLPLHAATF